MTKIVKIFGKIARHYESPFWGRIYINTESGRIERVERHDRVDLSGDHMFSSDCLIFPGFGDVHIHARQDQTGKQNYKETYKTATDAALNGGVVHVSAMPNTPDPVTGGQQLTWHRAHVCSSNYPVVVLNYLGIDATTAPLGVPGEFPYKCYFGVSVGTLSVIYASELDKILSRYAGQCVSFHVEYEPIIQMSKEGKTHSDRRPIQCVNEGLRLLLPLIEKHNIKAKLCHWSTGGDSFELIREYRDRGCHIDLEVSPLHLWFDTEMTAKDPSLWLKAQMNPAIQHPGHRADLIRGLKDGFIQFLATDHAPHTLDEKHSAFEKYKDRYSSFASNEEVAMRLRDDDPEVFLDACVKNNHSGAPWLDTYSLICCWLMEHHDFTPMDIARVAAYNPGRFVNQYLKAQYPGRDFGRGFGDIDVGYMGSLTVLNLERTTRVDRKNLRTKVGWSPLEGEEIPGAVEAVFIGGIRQ